MGICKCTMRVVYEVGSTCAPNTAWLIFIHYETEFGTRNGESGDRITLIAENCWLVLCDTGLGRLGDVIIIPVSGMNKNTMRKRGILWKGNIVNDAKIIFKAISDISISFLRNCARHNLLNNCVAWFRWFKKYILVLSPQIHQCNCKIFAWPSFGFFFNCPYMNQHVL